MRRGIAVALWLSFFLCGSGAQPAFSKDAGEVLKRTKSKYESIRYLTLVFEQRFEWKLTGEVQELTGRVFMAPGEKYRVETTTQTIVSDGKTIWTFNHPTNQVIVDAVGKDRTPLIRDLVLRYTRDYDVSLVGEEEVSGRKCWVLDLESKAAAEMVPRIRVWIDSEEYIVWQVVETDANGNVNRYRITAFEEPATLPAHLFSFQVPEGAELVDLRLE